MTLRMIQWTRFRSQDSKNYKIGFAVWRVVVGGFDFFEQTGESVDFFAGHFAGYDGVGDVAFFEVDFGKGVVAGGVVVEDVEGVFVFV